MEKYFFSFDLLTPIYNTIVMYLSIFHFHIKICNQPRGKNEITDCNIYGTIQI